MLTERIEQSNITARSNRLFSLGYKGDRVVLDQSHAVKVSIGSRLNKVDAEVAGVVECELTIAVRAVVSEFIPSRGWCSGTEGSHQDGEH